MRNNAVARVLSAVDTLLFISPCISTIYIQANDPLLVVHFIYTTPFYLHTILTLLLVRQTMWVRVGGE